MNFNYRHFIQLDSRSLSLFRILLGGSLLYNLSIKYYYVKEFWGETPIIPLKVFQALNGTNAFSIFDYIRSDLFAHSYFALTFIIISLFTLGYRTVWTAAISCFLYWNILQATASFVLGYDLYTFQLLFWACFLPLNQYWSIGVAKKTKQQSANFIFSLLLLYQIAWVYFATGLAKYGNSWMEGYAVKNMLMDQWATTALGKYLATQLWFYMPATYVTLIFEIIFPLLIFFPYKKGGLRYVASGFLVVFHLSILLTYHVANFSISGIAAAALLLPSNFWDRLSITSNTKHINNLKKNYIRKYIAYTLCLFAFLIITIKNIFFLSIYSPLRKTAFTKTLHTQFPYLEPSPIIHVSFFTQYWRMFAPDPPAKIGWIALEQLRDGKSYDILGEQMVTESPSIHWHPKGQEYYLMLYARTFNFPSGRGELYKIFLKYWIPRQLAKHNIPLSELDNIRLVEYEYYVQQPPYPELPKANAYRAKTIVQQDLTRLRMGYKFKK